MREARAVAAGAGQALDPGSCNDESLKRRLSEGSPRFHNHRQFHVYLLWVNAHLACECAFNQEKALVSVGLLRDCKIFATLRLTFVSSSSNDEDNPSQKHGT